MSNNTIGIDLGTSSIKLAKKGKDIFCQSNVISYSKDNKIIAFGDSANAMLDKTPENISVSFPMSCGVIADFGHMQNLLESFCKSFQKNVFRTQHNYILAVPSDITEVEKKAFYDLVKGSKLKTRKVSIINKPVADGLGMELNILEPKVSLIVDIGADTTEISVISLGGIVISKIIKIGGNKLDNSIILYVKKKYNLVIGKKTSENIKKQLACAVLKCEKTIPIMGRDVITGLPVTIEINSLMVYDAIKEYLHLIIDAVKFILERTPPELSRDIIFDGIFLTGGSSLIEGLDTLIESETELKVNVFQEPSQTAIKGLLKIIENKSYVSLEI